MPPPKAANDVSPHCSEIMLFAFAHNDAMFAPVSRRTHHARQGTSLPKATSFARKGKHHSKSSDLVNKSLLFAGGEGGIRTLVWFPTN